MTLTTNRAPGTFKTLTSLALAAITLTPLAGQAADAPIPNAGAILQQVQPPAATQPPASTGLTIEPARSTVLDSAPFEIRELQIRGNTRLDTASLHALVAEAEGQRMTLRDLGKFVDRITEQYRKAGYLLARAVLPVQTIRDGVVRIEVIEARYGQVLIDNKSRVRDALLQDAVAPLQPGAVVSQHELDGVLLRMSDILGMELSALLRPGQAVGSTDLALVAKPAAPVSAYVNAENNGNRYTGRGRIGGGLSYFNALGRGDVASVDVLSSGEGVNYARLGYELQVDGAGTRAGASGSTLNYRLGDTARELDAYGSADMANVWITHPWVRSMAFNVRSKLEYEHLVLQDRVGASAIRNDRHLDKVTASLSGDALSAWAGGTAEAWRLGVSVGTVGFDDEAARLADAATARSAGNFTLWSLYLSHSHNLGPATVLAAVLNGQVSTGNLDASQKFALSGSYAVRAYDTGEVQGDTGYTLSVELRQSLGALAGSGQWQAMVFADTGQVQVNRTPWAAGANDATISGVGVGLNWFGSDQWSARLATVTPTGADQDITGVSRNMRTWGTIKKGF
jgi:hemolysin activation/secretion protein